MGTLVIWMVVLFALLQLGDILTTYVILIAGGLELNPVINMCMRKLGVIPGLVLAKFVVFLFFLGLAYLTIPAPWVKWVIIVLNVVYVFVVLRNLWVLWRL